MIRKFRLLSGLAVATGLALSSYAAADTTISAENLRLQVLAGACANCHGTDGSLSGAAPVIAGRPATILEAQLLSFKRDEVPNATVMPRHAKGYSDEELSELAVYFSSIQR